jgi:hypothetical protein
VRRSCHSGKLLFDILKASLVQSLVLKHLASCFLHLLIDAG